MLDLAFLVLLLAGSSGAGLRVLGLLDSKTMAPTDRLALALPLGMGIIALAAFGLAEIGHLDRVSISLMLAFCVLGCFRSTARFVFGVVTADPEKRAATEIRNASPSIPRGLLVRLGSRFGSFSSGEREGGAMAREIPSLADSSPTEGRKPENGLPRWGLIDAALAVALAGSLLTALAPVTDGDALCYHLQVPKVFLQARGAVFEPDLHETVYPLLTEMLYAVALALRGPVACRLISWSLGVIFALNVTALARPVLGSRARWAGTIALLVPAVSNGMGAPLNDVALAAFGTAALHAWTRWFEHPSARAVLLAGLFAGLALGVKYPALVWVGLLGLALLATRRRASASHALIFATTALLIGGGWYARAYIHTGNPVHPFFRHTFGGAGIDDVLDPVKRPLAPTPWNLLTALAPMTLQPDRFDSFAHQFGPVFLLFLPGLFLFRPPRRVVGLAALGWTFLTICLTARQSMRFVLLAVGPMAVGVAWLIASWQTRRSVPSRVLIAAMLAVLGFETVIAAGHARHGLGVVLGLESPASFLARREPTWTVGQWIDRHLPPGARLIGQDHRGFYLPRSYTMELAHRRRTGLGQYGESAEEIVEQLRRRGFTHLLFAPPVPETDVEFDPTLSRLLEPWLAAREPLYDAELTDGDGVVRRYRIDSIQDENSNNLAAEEDKVRR